MAPSTSMMGPQLCATGTSAGPELKKVMRSVLAPAGNLPSGETTKNGRVEPVGLNHRSGQYRWNFWVWPMVSIRQEKLGWGEIRPTGLFAQPESVSQT